MASLVRILSAAVVVILLAVGGIATVGRQMAAPSTVAASNGNVDWPMFGNNSDNNRYSSLTQINAKTVKKLGLAWTMQEGKDQSVFETDPVVVNGTMYITTNTDEVMAVDAATGKLKWRYAPKVNFYNAISGGGGGVATNRGVTVVNGKVYLLTFDDQLIALQASTGEKLWRSVVASSTGGYSETSPPAYWNGMLFVGSAESDSGERGFVAAYNANNGKQMWRFYTVPASGQGWNKTPGHHGGGDVWMPPIVDTKLQQVYFGTGNPSPDEYAVDRKGCDPWVDAVVALKAKTGKFVWGHTEVCPDVWDYDSHQPPMIFNEKFHGKMIRAVGHGSKEGYYWVYDARTGKVLAHSTSPVLQSNPRPKPTLKGVRVCPGAAGGFEYSPPAYSPVTHMVYEPALNLCMIYQLESTADIKAHKQGAIDFGGSITPSPPFNGVMSAIDVRTGKIMWKTKMPRPMIGGSLATAGGLVFSGDDDGHFYAFDSRNGKILWSANLGLPFGAAPMTYMVHGTQYVAIADGGSVISGSENLPTGGTLAVFKLNGSKVHKLPVVSSGTVPQASVMPSLKGLSKVNAYEYANAKQQHVVIMMTAAATAANSGFNFDGYTKGQGTFVIPYGWNVEIEFSNKSRINHSFAVAKSLKPNAKLPIFGIAPVSTPKPELGVGAGVKQLLSFAALPAGNYYAVCLVPGHIASGMWDHLVISKTAKMPSIQGKKSK